MRSKEFNEKNPLTIYVRQISKQHFGEDFNIWTDISERAGMSYVSLIRICKCSKEEIMKIPLQTYILLRDNLDVDLLKGNY